MPDLDIFIDGYLLVFFLKPVIDICTTFKSTPIDCYNNTCDTSLTMLLKCTERGTKLTATLLSGTRVTRGDDVDRELYLRLFVHRQRGRVGSN